MTENEAKSIDDCLKELKGHRSEYLKRSTPWRIINRAVHLIEQLQALKDAEEKGLILRPKCRLGDVVYALWSVPTESKYVVYHAEVKEINLSSTNVRKMIMYKLEPLGFRGRYNKYYDDDFGKLVFMSLEEAEQALAKMQGT